jgi:hypothetical protein
MTLKSPPLVDGLKGRKELAGAVLTTVAFPIISINFRKIFHLENYKL